MYSLLLIHLTLTLKAKKTGNMPVYGGPIFHNELKKALYDQVCVNPNTPCAKCPYRDGCRYALFFDQPSVFIVQGPSFKSKKWTKSEEKTVMLTIFQPGYRGLVSLIESFFAVGERGVGRERIPFQLTSIQQRKGKQKVELLERECFSDQFLDLSPLELSKVKRLPKLAMVTLETPLCVKEEQELDNNTFIQLCNERLQQVLPNVPVYEELNLGENHFQITKLQRRQFTGSILFENISEEALYLLIYVEHLHLGEKIVSGYGKISVWMKYF